MSLDRAQTARGALAGAVAAAVWAAQSPLDSRVFGVDYLDQELLGKAVTRGPAWQPLGWAMHLAGGALFGAVYANVSRRVPLPGWARGPAAALTEHVATWPLVALSDRFHPARDELPRLGGSVPAFAQATWRHLLFGALLGEIERRLNGPPEASEGDHEVVVSTNGHGNLEHAVGVTLR
jgi:hypothetical protein